MKTYFLANWKQNGTADLLQKMLYVLNNLPINNEQEIALFPPAVYLACAKMQLGNIQLGAQNLSAHSDGAYTGEISGSMLKEVGASLVLVGHSERRHYFGDTDELVAEKFQQAERAGLIPVLCVGETFAEYEAGETYQIVERQLKSVLTRGMPKTAFMIAYEPVWAIGTGKAATPEQAEAVHTSIRHLVAQYTNHDCVARTPLLYGGSVKPENAARFLAMPEINGLLIGGASLSPEQFSSMIHNKNC